MQYCQGVADIKATQTSYAVLGLLALKPWTTYELARQSERSLRWFFPRAERAVYLEAKRLVALGWAQSTKTATGRRTSTVYTITRSGRTALRAWLAAPSAPPQLESEGAIKIFFADQAGTEHLRATVELLAEQADDALDQLATLAAGAFAFPERMRTNVLSLRLVSGVHQALADWAVWAADAVDVLDAGDENAVERQTRETLAVVASRGAGAQLGTATP
jgi:DNA-binding PadR family transcriptional regulator